MPLFCGRKAQVSRLFLLHRLAGSARHGSGFKTVTALEKRKTINKGFLLT